MSRQFLTVLCEEIGTVHQYELPELEDGRQYEQLCDEIFDFMYLRGFKSGSTVWMVHDREGMFFDRDNRVNFLKEGL